MARVVWTPAARSVLRELPARVQLEIAKSVRLLRSFPRLYPMTQRGRFRKHRRFFVRGWVVYYRVVENTVYVRGLWPARIS